MNILVFGQSYLSRIGGVQQFYASLYKYLVMHGHKITHVAYRPIGERGLHYPFPPEVDVRTVNAAFGNELQQKIVDITRAVEPDAVLIVMSNKLAGRFCFALRQSPYPVVLSEHGSSEYCVTRLWGSRRLHELGVWNADFMHVLMPSYKNILPDYLHSRVRVIRSLTQQAERFAEPDKLNANDQFTLLYVGRFSCEKRVSLLVEAFSLLADKFPAWQLRLVGEGPECGILEKLIAEKGLGKRVELPGYASSPEILDSHYAESHLFCLPSSAEGCPLALCEAMSRALPVAGFASCSGTNEIIVHEQNGLLVPQDTAESLANSLSRLMDNSTLRKNLGESGREDVRQYSPEKTHKAWEDLLQEAASWKGRKKMLRAGRFMRHPVASFNAWFQTSFQNERTIYAKNPLERIKCIGSRWLDYGLLNLFYEERYFGNLSAEEIMNYASPICTLLNKQDSEGEIRELQIAKNAMSLAMRSGINLNNIYY